MAAIEEDPTVVEEVKSQFSELSIVDLIRQEAKELEENKEVLIPVSGYEGTGLQVKYHIPDSGKELDDIARKVFRESKDQYYRNINTAIDTIIWLCSGLFVQPSGVDEPVMLDPQETGSPVYFDARLAEMLGADPTAPARSVVKKLFGNNDMAILSHAGKLNRWLQDTKADLTLELWQVGEM